MPNLILDALSRLIASPMSKRGYTDNPDRIPPGWNVLSLDKWPINNPSPGSGVTFSLEKWKFRTCGEVDNPLELSYAEFQALPHVTKTLDHHCIDGWSYLGQSWDGVDISVIKEATRVSERARFVMIEGEHIASQRFPVDQDLLLADGQEGSKLLKTVGYPLRIVAPGEFGYRSRKWVDTIRFCSEMEQDDLEQGFEKAGAYPVYVDGIRSTNPWTVDDGVRKRFLRTVFTHETAEVRGKRRLEHLAKNTTAHNIQPSVHKNEVRLCSVENLVRSPAGLKVVVNGSEVLLVRCGDEVFATEPLCTHMGTDMSRGQVNPRAKTIKCPLHGALFDVANGNCLSGSYGSDGGAFPPIRTYRIRVEEDEVYLERRQEWGLVW